MLHLRPILDDSDLGAAEQIVPRGANGVPIFLILPPDIQASYDRKMKRCERGWQATSDPLAVSEALIYAYLFRQPPPLWLTKAVVALVISRRGKEHGKRAIEAATHLARYEMVRDAVGAGMTWDAAYVYAEEKLAEACAAASAHAMEASYKKVKRDLKAGRGGKYFRPKMPKIEKLG